MAIKVGDRMPAGTLTLMGRDGPEPIATDELFRGRKVVLFSVPGAFTPTCSTKHLPGYIENAGAIKGRGVDTIACMAVNDIHVMAAWGRAAKTGDDVLMLADGNAAYAITLGLEFDGSGAGMGTRGQRFSMVIDDGAVTQLNIEPPREFGVSSAEALLEQLG